MFYQIVNPGSGDTPGPTNTVFVKYTGKYISNNEVFDSQTNASMTGWKLGTLIPGWQLGLPLIQKGGIIRLVVPSSLAYGCRGYNTIPGDAVLYFEIELVNVTN